MNYKVSCPACAKKVSRWYIFLEPVVYHRCRGCGTRFRTGWTGVVLVVAIQIMWGLLAWKHHLKPPVAITLVAITCGLAVWLLPYFTSIHLKKNTGTKKPDDKVA